MSFVICFCKDGEKIVRILNAGGLQKKLNPSLIKRDKLISKLVCFAVFLFVGVFVVVVITNNMIGSTTDLYDKFMTLTGGVAGSGLDKWCGYACHLFKRSRESAIGGAILGIWLAVSYSVEFVWVSFLVLMTGWGIYFRRLMQGCVDDVENDKIGVSKVGS